MSYSRIVQDATIKQINIFVIAIYFKMKTINLKSIISIAIFLVFGQIATAQLRLPNFFSSNMVLQRETDARIWGWGNAGSTVKIVRSWAKDTVTTTTDGNGKWKAKIATNGAGGPYTLTILSGAETLTLSDVLLGDLFICSGQSNMEWGGNQNLKEILDELPHANNPNIRLLQVNRNGAGTPQENISNSWSKLDEKSLKPFSGIGYFIAKEINREVGVPIGVINASWGGTPAEVWTPKELVEADDELFKYSKTQVENAYRPKDNGILWNSMIAPLVGLNVKAIFWYQGESNVGTWAGYDKLMKVMVNSWRTAWNEQLPFYFVQIAPYTYNNKVPMAALLREQQSKTALELSKAGMVVITDLVDNIKDIHPSQKKEVANRLSRMALAEIYGKPLVDYKSPIYKNYRIIGNKIEITFHNLTGNLRIRGNELSEIYISGEDHVFHKAAAQVKKDKLIVYSKDVSKPIAVRFGFTETAMPNLFTEKGLPVSPFRTDDWTQ